MRFTLVRGLLTALLSLSLAPPLVQAEEAGEVNIYSYRQPYLIEPMLKEFTDETRVKINVIYAEKGLINTFPSKRGLRVN